MINLNNQKAVMHYPTKWNYKVIGRDKFALKRSINEALFPKEFSIKESKTSTKGKFVSLNIDLEVESEKERVEIYNTLNSLNEVLQII